MNKNGCHGSRKNVSNSSSENKVKLNGTSFFFLSGLDICRIKSRIISEIAIMSLMSLMPAMLSLYAHVRYWSCDLLLKKIVNNFKLLAIVSNTTTHPIELGCPENSLDLKVKHQ